MNATGITILATGVWLMSSTLVAQENPAEPDFDTVDMIEIEEPDFISRWRGTFWSDGSAWLERVDNSVLIVGLAEAPTGSFSFKKTRNFIKPHLSQEKDAGAMQARLYFGYSDTIGRQYYIKDKKVMRKLMHGLRDKVMPHYRSGFEELLGKYPLVPGDDPAPITYYRHMDAKTYMEAYYAAFKLPVPADGEWVDVTHLSRPVPSETAPVSPGRAWLYGGILAALCVGAVLWFIRKKK